MYTFDGIITRLTLPLAFFLVVGLIASCDETPIVGGNLSPDDVVVNADTALITNLSVARSPSFSGIRLYSTAGRVVDPVFGEIKATALMRPSISRVEQADTIGENAVAHLSLNIDSQYGSAAAPADFYIVELGRPWRSSSWRYDSIPDFAKNPDLSPKVIGQFTLSGTDSISVPLSDEWISRYREIFSMSPGILRDSLYRADMPGLAIIPAGGTDRMFSVEMPRARLLIQSGNGLGDLSKEFDSWAVSLEMDNPEEKDFGAAKPVFNTMSSMLEIDIDFTEEFLGTVNFSRVELVLYEDTVRMQSGLPADFERPRSETMRIYILEPEQLYYAISGEPRFQVNQRESDRSYRINLTSLVNEQLRIGGDDGRKFYAVIGSNDGRFLPVLLSGSEDHQRKPKLLITSISKKQ